MIKLRNNSWSLIILILLFVAPGVAAVVFYNHPTWLGGSETNRGTFVKQPAVFNYFDKSDNWRLVFYSPSVCDETCMQKLDSLARVRLALGRQLYNVDTYLLLDNNTKSISKKKSQLLDAADVSVLKFPAKDGSNNSLFGAKPAFYIINPKNYIILTYDASSPPDDIFQDIKKLVKD
jgi:hypothetical protein